MTWLILRFYDISCSRVDRIFYRMLLLLNSMCLKYLPKYLVRIWLLRYYILLCITSFYIITDYILLYNLMCLEFWERLHQFGLITCFTTQLAQRRCDNVVTTSWLTLSQRCGKVENESCGDVSFRRCENVVVRRC